MYKHYMKRIQTYMYTYILTNARTRDVTIITVKKWATNRVQILDEVVCVSFLA